ncbi:Flavoprotein [Penicillium macrosclerotiorum]|uniref:Flavoprotein n=1 Tax=Penicillium macrosclerotiorum TaxID=303699 RepID=UPI002548A80D|nr:Flavoprotein [Penicillium macrosclerotiorum]KAJ5692058.1 Flavoprotein [Penicillium macrosclerotiorum]
MKVVAFSAGSTGGNTELTLLTALREVQIASPSASITPIRLNEVSIGNSTIAGQIPHPFVNSGSQAGTQTDLENTADDRPFMLEHILEADAILLGAPVYSRVVTWLVKWFQDRTLGPAQDIDLANTRKQLVS